MKIGIIGLGLIGGSLGRAIVSKTKDEVFAFDIDKKAMLSGKLLSAYHYEITEQNIGELDMVFFTLYPDQLEKSIEQYCKKLKKGCLVLDCCGNKRRIVAQMRELAIEYPDLEFISTHPMAGREFSGVSHSTVGLFERASMIVVPVKASLKTVAKLKEYALLIGFGTVVMSTAEEHDEIIAFTSQLAHIVSSSYIKSDRADKFLGYSAGSFRDMTRVARLVPEMWAQLTIDNSDFLVEELDSFIRHLTEYKTALENGDKENLQKLFADGNERKLLSEKMRREKNNDR